jgi:hypothetical protein
MASNKAKIFEQVFEEELHPFAARRLATPPSERPNPKAEVDQSRNRDVEKVRQDEIENPRMGEGAISRKHILYEKRFDLNEKADDKRGIPFTRDEMTAVDLLKAELWLDLDLKVNQYDIIRIGVHTIIDDYRKNGENSIVVRRAKSKRAK